MLIDNETIVNKTKNKKPFDLNLLIAKLITNGQTK